MRIFVLFAMAFAVAQAPVHSQLAAITNQPSSRAMWAGGNVTFAVGVSNAGAFTYQWLFNSTNLPNGIITTIVGNGSYAFSGDGGPATAAGIEPDDIAVDSAGNLFLADRANSRIRRVDTNGIINTIAGNASLGFSEDGVAATNSSLNMPWGVALDATGNVFIADSGNFRVRRVDTNGIITTVAGTNTEAYAGDGGSATNASLMYPWNLAFDPAGNLFIACLDDDRVRRVAMNGIIATFAGNGAGSFSGDGGPATNFQFSYAYWNEFRRLWQSLYSRRIEQPCSHGKHQRDYYNRCRQWWNWLWRRWRASHQHDCEFSHWLGSGRQRRFIYCGF